MTRDRQTPEEWQEALLRNLATPCCREKLVAATMTHPQFLSLRSVVRVIRRSGVPINAAEEELVKKFERTVAEYQRLHNIPADQGPTGKVGVD